MISMQPPLGTCCVEVKGHPFDRCAGLSALATPGESLVLATDVIRQNCCHLDGH